MTLLNCLPIDFPLFWGQIKAVVYLIITDDWKILCVDNPITGNNGTIPFCIEEKKLKP